MSNTAREKSVGDKLAAKEVNEDLPIELTAGTPIATTPLAVYISNYDGLCYLTDANYGDDRIHNFIGFAVDIAGGSGSPITIQTHGKVTGFSGLTYGKKYYLSTEPGEITTSTPTVYSKLIGIATSTPELVIIHKGLSLGPETLRGVKTFGSIPILPTSTPIGVNDATRKGYFDYVIGDYLKIASDGVATSPQTTYTKVKAFGLDRGGTLRISFALEGDTSTTVYAKIYRNDTPVGTERSKLSSGYETFTEDISGWSEGELVELRWKSVTGTSAHHIKEFRMHTGNWRTLEVV